MFKFQCISRTRNWTSVPWLVKAWNFLPRCHMPAIRPMPMLIYFFPKREIWQVHPKKTDSTWGSVTSDFWTLMQHLEIPRRRKFYQGPGLKHTSDIFHVLKKKLYHSFQSPHGGSAWCLQKNKQTNDRVSNIGTYFSCVFVFSFMNYNHRYSWNYF